MSVTVVIPTYKRPEMLRSALISVSRQSRLDLVHEIIVSENSEDTCSHQVCAEFKHLPIRHRYQHPLVPVGGQHFHYVVSEATTTWVAMLGDDDLWGRYHLEEAFRALECEPKAVGYCAQAAVVRNASRQIHCGYTRLLHAYLHKEGIDDSETWLWTPAQTLVESLLRTPLNMWALVARRDPLLSAIQCFCDDHPGIDADRLFMWRLSCFGPLIVGREVSLFYRLHDANASSRMIQKAPEHHSQMSHTYTSLIIREAEQAGMNPKVIWAAFWQRLAPSTRADVLENALPGSADAVRLFWGQAALAVPGQPAANGFVSSTLKEWLPPVLKRQFARLKRHLASSSAQTRGHDHE